MDLEIEKYQAAQGKNRRASQATAKAEGNPDLNLELIEVKLNTSHEHKHEPERIHEQSPLVIDTHFNSV